jgi:hypothetical protein
MFARKPKLGSSDWKRSGNWAEPRISWQNLIRFGSRQTGAIFVWCRRIWGYRRESYYQFCVFEMGRSYSDRCDACARGMWAQRWARSTAERSGTADSRGTAAVDGRGRQRGRRGGESRKLVRSIVWQQSGPGCQQGHQKALRSRSAPQQLSRACATSTTATACSTPRA